jgi:hypothetical protein
MHDTAHHLDVRVGALAGAGQDGLSAVAESAASRAAALGEEARRTAADLAASVDGAPAWAGYLRERTVSPAPAESRHAVSACVRGLGGRQGEGREEEGRREGGKEGGRREGGGPQG